MVNVDEMHTHIFLSQEQYKKFPIYTLVVNGQNVHFMVDTGATHSVIQDGVLTPAPGLSGDSILSISASGHQQRERFTVPLTCSPSTGSQFTHKFLLSKLCPINLLGRDLMCQLRLTVVSGPEGLSISGPPTGPEEDNMSTLTMVKYCPLTPNYVYQWKIGQQPTSLHWLELCRARVAPSSVFMEAADLHCTSYFCREGPDDEYEEQFFKQTHDRLILQCLVWDKSFCALSVQLTPTQSPLFRGWGGSSPHISLARPSNRAWKHLGAFMLKASRAKDWEPTSDPHVLYSSSARVYCQALPSAVHCQRTVRLECQYDSLLSLSPCASPSTTAALDSLPKQLWAENKYDVGLIRGCEPVVITPKSSFRPCQKQYPLKQEAVAGITPVFHSLLKAGVIVPCPSSPVRTPLFPVKKIRGPGEPVEWRFVQDLQAVNRAVVPRSPTVPNPHTILSQIPSTATFFSVIDLSNAFFSVPVHPDSQYWFAFEFEGKPYTFTRLCQGYCESPTIYNAALRDSLSSLVLSPGSVLLQYVDDLLVCAPTEEQCQTDTLALLRHLCEQGHKVSRKKLQFVLPTVTFLGHVISCSARKLSDSRVAAIRNIPKPVTKKQMMSFLGMTGYCRNFIPNYSFLESPLTRCIYGSHLAAQEPVPWTTEAEAAFVALKEALLSAPALALPDPTKPFTQMVDEKNGFMSSVLLQAHGDLLRPVGYYSSRLDAVAAGLPHCLRAVAAAEKAVLASRDIVGYSQLTVMVPHSVSVILLEQRTSHLSAARWLRYTTVLLDMPNITVQRCTRLNAATLLPTEEDGEPHQCDQVLSQVCTPRVDLSDSPLPNSDLILYVDGSSSRDVTGRNRVGFAVCSDHDTLVSGSLPAHFSAQTAELVALTEACKLSRGKTVTIYTDSRYAFGVVHDFGVLWKHRNFLTSGGKPILNASQVSDLLDAILLPSAVAVVKCSAHTGSADSVSRGNAAADAAARRAASAPPAPQLTVADSEAPSASLAEVQSLATPDDRRLWSSSGCRFADGVWVSSDGRPCLPRRLFPHFAKLAHGVDHVSKGGMVQQVTSLWFTRGFSVVAERHCKTCLVCAAHNVGHVRPVGSAAHPPSEFPFDHLMMDFVELTPAEDSVSDQANREGGSSAPG
ncbi:uncharacterized protein LOC115408159 isoform X1 [Salarias fasciatus]|uniref:uncharacterized protein LOC115408159 isoform X1 n=1 Tax=Salarias fasciatus TaxID=181472 RepID=UPI0011770221|nr:uncharacterized protein LOC115408159 isoform X1 [Salarias fasciatus]